MNTLAARSAQPRMAADFAGWAICGPVVHAPDVGHGVDDKVAAIRARPGMISTPPADVTIGGFDGQMLDVHLAPSWTGGCQGPGGQFVGTPILVGASGFTVDIRQDHPLRLILLDLGDERTMSVAISSVDLSQPSQLEEQAAEVMPVIESFEFHPPMPYDLGTPR